jgi:glycine dehydrogenase subunit 1
MNFGGPLLGFMACQEKLIRQMPGRIVSATKDIDGKDGFVLTLQTREQHIRREKATSNICTNQGLLATRATIYLSLLGENGLAELGRVCHGGAHRLADMISGIDGYNLRFTGPFFREFVVECPVDAAKVAAMARLDGILAGIPLERYYGDVARNGLLVSVTEKHTAEDFESLVAALRAARHKR